MNKKTDTPFGGIFRGERVLVTGHTGFKGAWLALWLKELGACVTGYSVDVPTDPSLFEALGLRTHVEHIVGDVRDFNHLNAVLVKHKPRVVFHLAAQAILRRSYQRPKETIDSNLGGTVNLLEAARTSESVESLVIVTSDKCYEENPDPKGYGETDRLGGRDPYSASKAMAELAVSAYRRSFLFSRGPAHNQDLKVATARAGNVIGGGDFGEDRLVPDCIRAFMAEAPAKIRNPDAVRPWQFVLEPLSGYLLLGARLLRLGDEVSGAWNFGPGEEGEVVAGEVVDQLGRQWGGGRWEPAKTEGDLPEAGSLRICCQKAARDLGWFPLYRLEEALAETVAWYRAFSKGEEPTALMNLCIRQIRAYVSLARKKGMVSLFS
jgi:CDP-glucose 4,6-dehydratase